ncbi:MAG: hypothetical protein M3065_19935 [Actinomycetota bacterium]|nr:hypothetical protein [Actinomycetota bacterium]
MAVSVPTSITLLGTQVAASATGAAAVSFNEVNMDAQAIATAFVALAPAHGAFTGQQAVPGVQEVLAIAYSGSTLELLTASSPTGQPCCSTVQVIRRGPRSRFGRPQTLVTNAGGGTTGRLVPLSNGRMLAVIGGPQRLWASEAQGSGRFGAVRGLTRPGFPPAALAVTGTTGGGSTVAWTQGSAQTVMTASAGPGGTPSRRHTVLTLAPGHAISGLQLAARPDGLTMAWTESWSDAAGAYHSQANAADVVGHAQLTRPRALSAPADVASALALSGDANGAEVAAWDVCAPSSQACIIQSTSRPGEPPVPAAHSRHKAKKRVRARWFGADSGLGPIDPGVSPELATSLAGKSVIGWISRSRVVLATMRGGRSGGARRVSGGLAENLAVGFGPGGEAVATWSQETVAPRVYVSVLR